MIGRLSQRAAALSSDGKVVLPGQARWDEARRAWNLAVDQRPTAVVLPESAADVAAATRLAVELGLRVAPQATGHRAAPLGPLDGTILLRTGRMRAVEVDAAARTARIQAGAPSTEVVGAAARHGLAVLAGSGPDVGLVGYTLGGGIGWLARKHGLAASSVTAVELVTADGEFVRADRDHEPELFWALRGGGGSFGVVTALELRLLPITEVCAGILWWPIERDVDVLHTWRAMTQLGLPDELTTVARHLRYPTAPAVPEALRGKSFVLVEVVYLGERSEVDALLEPLRTLDPTRDTVDTIPVQALTGLHMDRPQPVAGVVDGLLLAALPAEAVEELLRVAGARAPSPLVSVELRHLGGELGRARPGNGALASVEGEFLVAAVGPAATPEQADAAATSLEVLRQALAPWTAPLMCLNFADTSRDPRTLWNQQAYERLRRVKAAVDSTDRIRANHPVPPWPAGG
jgi:FAD binding domain